MTSDEAEKFLRKAARELTIAANGIHGEVQDAVQPFAKAREIVEDIEIWLDELPRCRMCDCRLRENHPTAICDLCYPEED